MKRFFVENAILIAISVATTFILAYPGAATPPRREPTCPSQLVRRALSGADA